MRVSAKYSPADFVALLTGSSRHQSIKRGRWQVELREVEKALNAVWMPSYFAYLFI